MKMPVSIPVAAVLTLSACHRQPALPTLIRTASQKMLVSQARLMLPAVKGNPGAGYFVLVNDSTAPATLVHVDVVGAQNTEMHETSGGSMRLVAQVRIDPGQRVAFAPAGKHVMVFGLAPTMAPGDTGQLVFHFQDGKVRSAPLRIEAAGDGPGDMAGMSGSVQP